ncbi:MAG TPA: BrnA antitoxin family protein [Rhodothermales bacterium]|nr:BrnA antitoxin family protein [Rhodothermales bacterium]
MSKEHIVRYTREQIAERIARGEDGTDWNRIENLTEEEIERRALEENSELGIPDDWYKNAVPISSVKDRISIRLDHDVLEWFRGHYDRYQTQINAVLRSYMDAHVAERKQ